MNTNPENPSTEIEDNIKPGVTRRSFVKRTAATTLFCVLATYAFRAEAAGGGSGSGGKYMLHLTGWPQANITFTGSDGHQEVQFGDIDETFSAPYAGYTWTCFSRTRVSPNDMHSVKVPPSDKWHFLDPTSFEITQTITISVSQGATSVGTNTFTRSGTLGASLEDENKGTVSGEADATAPNTYSSTASFGGKSYHVAATTQALSGNSVPLGTSASPSFSTTVSIYENDGPYSIQEVLNGSAGVSFTWASFKP